MRLRVSCALESVGWLLSWTMTAAISVDVLFISRRLGYLFRRCCALPDRVYSYKSELIVDLMNVVIFRSNSLVFTHPPHFHSISMNEPHKHSSKSKRSHEKDFDPDRKSRKRSKHDHDETKRHKHKRTNHDGNSNLKIVDDDPDDDDMWVEKNIDMAGERVSLVSF